MIRLFPVKPMFILQSSDCPWSIAMSVEADISTAAIGEDPVTDLLVRLDRLVIEDETGEALELLLATESEPLIELGCMDFIHWIAGYVLRKQCLYQENQDRWQCMKSMLEYVVKFGKPKEALLGLLNQLETYSYTIVSDVFAFELWLKQARAVLLRLPVHQDYTRWGFSLVSECFSHVPVPSEQLLEPDEVAFLRNDPKLDVLLAATDVVVDFIQPFVEEVTKCRRKQQDVNAKETQKQIIAAFLLSLLDSPFADMDFRLPLSEKLGPNESLHDCTELHVAVEKLLGMLFSCYPYGATSLDAIFGELTLQTKFATKESISRRLFDFHKGLITLSYLNRYVSLHADYQVYVYSSEYWFEGILRHLPPVVNLELTEEPANENFVEKVLCICESYLASSNGQVWTKDRLDEDAHRCLLLWLIRTAAGARLESRRKRAVDIFRLFISRRFDTLGQITLVKFIFAHFQDKVDVGAKGFLIDFYKKQLHETRVPQGQTVSEYWKQLPDCLTEFAAMPMQVEMDLMDNYQQLIAALNLLLYVLAVRGNATVDERKLIEKVLKDLEERYFVPFQRALDFSKAHYMLELAKVREGQGDVCGKVDGMNDAVFLQSAVNSLELMEYVLCRCKETFRH